MTELAFGLVMLLAVLAWRPKPSDPCPLCHLPEPGKESCRQWCGA